MPSRRHCWSFALAITVLVAIRLKGRQSVHLECESTGEDAGQEDGVLADDGSIAQSQLVLHCVIRIVLLGDMLVNDFSDLLTGRTPPQLAIEPR